MEIGPRLESARGRHAALAAEEGRGLQQLADYRAMLRKVSESKTVEIDQLRPLIDRLLPILDQVYFATEATADLPESHRPYRCPTKSKYRTKPPVPKQRKKRPPPPMEHGADGFDGPRVPTLEVRLQAAAQAWSRTAARCLDNRFSSLFSQGAEGHDVSEGRVGRHTEITECW